MSEKYPRNRFTRTHIFERIHTGYALEKTYA